MSAYNAEVLAQQLAQLGRDLDSEVVVLGVLEHAAVSAEGEYRRLLDEHEDAFASAFLGAEGSVEMRKAQSRLKCVPSRLIAGNAWKEWGDAKADVRMQQASLNALHKRIDIGRSLLSRERALISLAGVGET